MVKSTTWWIFKKEKYTDQCNQVVTVKIPEKLIQYFYYPPPPLKLKLKLGTSIKFSLYQYLHVSNLPY